MTDREAFEAWHSRNYDTLPGTELHRVERQGMHKAWIAALASERAKQAEPVGEKRIANAIHYPACWDTAACPELDDALAELFQWFRCQQCAAPPADDEAVRLLRDIVLDLDAGANPRPRIDAYLAGVRK